MSVRALDWCWALGLSLILGPFSWARGQPAPSATAQPQADEPEALLGELTRASGADQGTALEELAALGDTGARQLLVNFGSRPIAERRALVALCARLDSLALGLEAASYLEDPDPTVRAGLCRLLARATLGPGSMDERVLLLARRAQADVAPEVRAAAREGLAQLPGVPAATALTALLDDAPLEDEAELAKLLSERPSARLPLAQRVLAELSGTGGEAQRRELAPSTLAALLPAVGRALAELPGGGERDAELAPLVRARTHPSRRVQFAAVAAVDALLTALAALEEPERAARALERLSALGWDPLDCDHRLVSLHLSIGVDIEAARAAAGRLAHAGQAGSEPIEREYRLLGLYFGAAAEFASGEPLAALAPLGEARLLAQGLISQRMELRPFPGAGRPGPGREAVRHARLGMFVQMLELHCLLASGAPVGSGAVLECARELHRQQLALQLRIARAGLRDEAYEGGLDSLFRDALSPGRLVLQNQRNQSWPRGPALKLMHDVLIALVSIAPEELPGIVPIEGLPARLADPVGDPERLALLLSIQRADLDDYERMAMESWGHPFNFPPDVRMQIERLEQAIARDPANEYADARSRRAPSQEALGLAERMRADGRAGECIQLAQRVIDDLAESHVADLALWIASFSARCEIVIGGAYMDEDLAREAEQALLSARRRLEEREAGLRERLEAETVALRRLAWEAEIRRSERLRADALTSLAVNANVRLGEIDRALAFFEEAYALDPNEFASVLLACYRARMGRNAEARALLTDISPSPNTHYNMACTFALLGDLDLALDFLARDLEENHPSEGSRQRQRDWARSDPDLSALRDDARFQRLVRAAQE